MKTTGILFSLIKFFKKLILISCGMPTYPSSSLSGIILIMLFTFELIDTNLNPFYLKSQQYILKSIKTFSTIEITSLSVTLSPFINFDWIFFFFNSLSILGPPP